MVIELAGSRVVTDPVLRPRVAHLRRHAPAPAPGPVDGVLLSHLHFDHADRSTLRRLPPDVPVVGPPGTASILGRPAHELEAGSVVDVGSIAVHAVRAVHDGRRLPIGPPRAALGYVLRGQQAVYFAGDTACFADMAALGAIDLALLPVWGWGPTLGPGHMDPTEAARAAALIRPRIAVPIHWGTYLPVGLARRHPGLLTSPGPAFAAEVAVSAPGVRPVVLAPGGRLAL